MREIEPYEELILRRVLETLPVETAEAYLQQLAVARISDETLGHLRLILPESLVRSAKIDLSIMEASISEMSPDGVPVEVGIHFVDGRLFWVEFYSPSFNFGPFERLPHLETT